MIKPAEPRQRGFTLLEMAMVLLVIGLLLGGGLVMLGAQLEQQRIRHTQAILTDAHDALLGFAIIHGRLPCPATAASNGIESPPGGGACSNPYNGFLPAATLGLPGVDANGLLSDAWGSNANHIRYAVSSNVANGHVLTTTDGIKNAGITSFSPDLHVCADANGIGATTCGAAIALSTNAVAVIFSLGKNNGSAGPDEAANQNNDPVFVSRTPSATYDDIMIWLSPSILYNRMVQAGRLP